MNVDVHNETLVRSKRGDHAAFADLVRIHQGMVYGLACHFLREPAVAEELSQDVFLELFQRLEGIQSMEHLRFWLRRVTSNRCIDAARRRKVRGQIGLDEVPEPAAPDTSTDPLLSGTLSRYVGSLPEAQRMVVILRFQEDLSPGEISDLLDMPVNTVKSHLQRSLAMLRAKLTPYIGGVAV